MWLHGLPDKQHALISAHNKGTWRQGCGIILMLIMNTGASIVDGSTRLEVIGVNSHFDLFQEHHKQHWNWRQKVWKKWMRTAHDIHINSKQEMTVQAGREAVLMFTNRTSARTKSNSLKWLHLKPQAVDSGTKDIFDADVTDRGKGHWHMTSPWTGEHLMQCKEVLHSTESASTRTPGHQFSNVCGSKWSLPDHSGCSQPIEVHTAPVKAHPQVNLPLTDQHMATVSILGRSTLEGLHHLNSFRGTGKWTTYVYAKSITINIGRNVRHPSAALLHATGPGRMFPVWSLLHWTGRPNRTGAYIDGHRQTVKKPT